MAKIKIIDAEILEKKTVLELRELCKKYGIIGMSKARKDDILESISDFYDSLEEDKEESCCSGPVQSKGSQKVPFINAGLHSTLNKQDSYDTTISISCGASSFNGPVVGKTVGYVKAVYREILNIEVDSTGVVNGGSVSDSYVLKSCDTLEFIRKAGSKG